MNCVVVVCGSSRNLTLAAHPWDNHKCRLVRFLELARPRPAMSPPRVGIWLIGARGGVAATATVGLIGLQKQLTQAVGLVSELPYFTGVDFAAWPSFRGRRA